MASHNKLRKLMGKYRVDNEIVAKILTLSPITVKIYRSKSGNNITDNDLELLKYKLAENYKIQ
jgi:hypothetical protein